MKRILTVFLSLSVYIRVIRVDPCPIYGWLSSCANYIIHFQVWYNPSDLGVRLTATGYPLPANHLCRQRIAANRRGITPA